MWNWYNFLVWIGVVVLVCFYFGVGVGVVIIVWVGIRFWGGFWFCFGVGVVVLRRENIINMIVLYVFFKDMKFFILINKVLV